MAGTNAIGNMFRCVDDGLDDLVVASAAAEISRQGVTDIGLGRTRIAIEQGLGGHQETRRADAALKAGVFEKLLLQNVQRGAGGESLDSGDGFARGFNAEHQARAYGAAVDDHGACTAVTGKAAFFAAGHIELVTQDFEQALARFAQEFDGVAVDYRFDNYFLYHDRCRLLLNC